MPSFVFRWLMTVEPGHCDPSGLVSTRRLFEYFDTSTWGLFEAALGVKRQDFPAMLGMMPLVKVRLDRRKALMFGDVIAIASRVVEFRRSSFEVEHRITLDGHIAVDCGETRVWAVRAADAPHGLRSRAISAEIKARFG